MIIQSSEFKMRDLCLPPQHKDGFKFRVFSNPHTGRQIEEMDATISKWFWSYNVSLINSIFAIWFVKAYKKTSSFSRKENLVFFE